MVGGLLSAVGVAHAGGWQEVHQTSDDVRVTVGPDGMATVQHHLRYRVVAGRFKSLDFTGVDPHADLKADATLLPEKGGEIAAHVESNPKSPGAVKLTFDEPKGIGRGVYVIDVSYRIDLVATKMLSRDGAMWRLAWVAPASPEGRDGARVVFELPPAPTEPRLAAPEQAATTLATLRREADKDELELLRARVPRGESVTWSARVDPKAFPQVTAPELRPAPRAAAAASEVPDRVPLILAATALALVAGALAFALRSKQAAVAAACARAGVAARPLLGRLPTWLAPFAYGASGAGGLALLVWGAPMVGAALVLVAMMLATHRSPRPIVRPRGPGRWRRIADEEVLVPTPREALAGDALDATTSRGRGVAALLLLLVAAAAFLLRTRAAGIHVALPLSAAVLVPLLVTGTRAQLPRGPAELASRVLGPARDALSRTLDLAHVELELIARFSEGREGFDEVRLSCVPADRIPGLRAIELALAGGGSSLVALPELLVRYDDGSAAAARVAELAPGLPVVSGRTPEEKVLRLSPRVPTPRGAARLLARVAAELEERRAPAARARGRRYPGIDRRIAVAAASPSDLGGPLPAPAS